jgi:hypothetical protein
VGPEGFYSGPPMDGAFQVSRAIPGKYRVGFDVPDPLYVSSARSGDTDLLATPELVVGAGFPPEIEVVLRSDGGSIEGAIAPETMRDDAVCILLVPESLNGPTAGTCAGDGRFEFDAVAPGSYRLHAWKGSAEVESIEYNDPQVRRTLAASGTRVEVRPAAKTQVQLRNVSEVLQ